MPSPEEIHARVPISDKAAETVFDGRETIKRILDRKGSAALRRGRPLLYSRPGGRLRLRPASEKAGRRGRDTLYSSCASISRSRARHVGWKGFINDPRMDDSFHIEEGMEKARAFLLQVDTNSACPRRREALDPIAPQYLGRPHLMDRDRRAHLRIPDPSRNGVRPVDAGRLQERHGWHHRGGASTPSSPPRSPHSFLGINAHGRTAIVRTRGNAYGHIVLRGGGGRPNYDTVSISLAEKALIKAKFAPNIVVDCSHANS